MKRNEALNILGLDASASDEDAKKKYRELSKKYHPDINKEPGAEDHFKKINAAYAAIQNPEPEKSVFHDSVNFEDIIQNMQEQVFYQNHYRSVQQLKLPLTLTFEEAVKGCEKDISFDRNEMCTSCKGIGANFVPRATPCATCSGKGQVVIQQGNLRISRTCHGCMGQNKIKVPCKACSGMGAKSVKRTCKVNIPQGVTDGVVLRLAHMGHFVSFGFGAQYSDAFLEVRVTSRPGYSLQNNDVISSINVSLLDCLQGKTIKESTLYGEVDIAIPPGSKNKDEIIIPGHGVRDRNGSHRFILNVQYPDQPKLIEFLKTLEN